MRIDLNCDLGEGCPCDAELIPLITSANIGCGAHAGDPGTMVAALELCKQHHVQVGAHPGFPDRESFGRAEAPRSEKDVWQDCVYQLGAMDALANTVGVPVRYVKPHGALYNLACRDTDHAGPVVRAAKMFGLGVMGLPKSMLERTAKDQGNIPFIAEGFADRRYLPDGSLVPRTRGDALIADPAEAAKQAEWLIVHRGVSTLCVHGDNPRALDFVRHLREHLRKAGYEFRAFEVPEY
jgi:UPF0271 protein